MKLVKVANTREDIYETDASEITFHFAWIISISQTYSKIPVLVKKET